MTELISLRKPRKILKDQRMFEGLTDTYTWEVGGNSAIAVGDWKMRSKGL